MTISVGTDLASLIGRQYSRNTSERRVAASLPFTLVPNAVTSQTIFLPITPDPLNRSQRLVHLFLLANKDGSTAAVTTTSSLLRLDRVGPTNQLLSTTLTPTNTIPALVLGNTGGGTIAYDDSRLDFAAGLALEAGRPGVLTITLAYSRSVVTADGMGFSLALVTEPGTSL